MIGFIKDLFDGTEPIRIGFEDVKQHGSRYLLINTLSIGEQDCLIKGTLEYDKEEIVINKILDNGFVDCPPIIVYGKHSADESVKKKTTQLRTFGFKRVYIYGGGLFEWLLLQEIYGFSEFPTTIPCKDLLRYRAPLHG